MSKVAIGITGQDGFIGWHLRNFLQLQAGVQIVPFQREYFEDTDRLTDFVNSCSVIFHLAAVNRHEDDQILYEINVELVKKLLSACADAVVKPHILFSSSTQEALDNAYGQSKRAGNNLFIDWANNDKGGTVTLMTIPNVFGPFCKPNYNSVVATFCHKLANQQQPIILSDKQVDLIYVGDLVREMYRLALIVNGQKVRKVTITPSVTRSVTDISAQLSYFKTTYLQNGVFPSLSQQFDRDLFNTFRCYISDDHYPVKLKRNTDNRGTFIEITRAESAGQFSYSTTMSGITRGNHFHTRKAERFAVIKGEAVIQLQKVGSNHVVHYHLNGNEPAYVDMPIWHTHNIKNVGESELLTLFWINEPYDPLDPDTYLLTIDDKK